MIDRVPCSVEVGHWCQGAMHALDGAVAAYKTCPVSAPVLLLIDDTGPDQGAHAERMIKALHALGVTVDQAVMESRLFSIAHAVFGKIPTNQHRQTASGWTRMGRVPLIRPDGRWSCPMLSACWTLCRLGVYTMPNEAYHHAGWVGAAEHAVSILPNELLTTEQQAMQIVCAAGEGKALDRVQMLGYEAQIFRPDRVAPCEGGSLLPY